MVDGLIAWTKNRLEEQRKFIGRAFFNAEVSVELLISSKEILEHLRSCLDYCAHEIYSQLPPQSQVRNVYFPISSKNGKQEDFPSFANTKINGILENRPDLIELLAKFQAFHSVENSWLPDLATLCNESKHIQLSLQSAEPVHVEMLPPIEGKPVLGIRMRHEKMYSNFHVGFSPSSGATAHPGYYFRFDTIDKEVCSFLSQSMDGVEGIVAAIKNSL